MNVTIRTKQLGEYLVRELSAGEAKSVDKIKKEGGDVLAFLAFSCTQKAGTPAFATLDETSALPFRIVKEIADTVLELSGLLDDSKSE